MDPDRVIIFDTTLRDGEQSPGISLNVAEKLEIAQQLARLGVDVIEAGFPISSPGDFEAVQAIAREVHGPVICGLARANAQDYNYTKPWHGIEIPILIGIGGLLLGVVLMIWAWFVYPRFFRRKWEVARPTALEEPPVQTAVAME